MKVKSILASIIAISLMFSLTACNNETEVDTSARDRDRTTTAAADDNAAPAMADGEAPATTAANETEEPAPTETEPEPEPVFCVFADILAEYRRTYATSSHRYGVTDGVAFLTNDWHDFIIHDIAANDTSFVHIKEGIWTWKIMNGRYFNGNIYGVDDHYYRLGIYDLKGNQIRQSPFMVGYDFYFTENGRILLSDVGWRLMSNDFQTITPLPNLTVDIGHGLTDERSVSEVIFVYDNKAYVKFHNVSETYIIDLVTMSVEESEIELPRGGYRHLAGKYYVINLGGRSGLEIINVETGERFPAVLSNINDEAHFFITDTSFYTWSRSTLYRCTPPISSNDEWEIVFEGGNNARFYVLNDEYFVVSDNVGTFLYKFGEDLPTNRIEMPR